MKKFLFPVFIISLFVLLQGCVEVKTTIKIKSDGSGIIEETMLVSSEIIDIIKSFAEGFADPENETEESEKKEFSLYDEEDLKKRAAEYGDGVNFLSGSELKKEGKEGYFVVYSFDKVNNLRIDQNPGNRMPNELGVSFEESEKEYLALNFTKGNPSEILITLPDISTDDSEYVNGEEDTSEVSLDEMEQMKLFMKDLSFSLNIAVDGKIVESNASYMNDSEITLFSINFNDLIDNADKLDELRKTNPQGLQQLKELLQDIPGIKIETNNPVIIKFQ